MPDNDNGVKKWAKEKECTSIVFGELCVCVMKIETKAQNGICQL